MHIYVISCSDGYFSEVLSHDILIRREELEAFVDEVPAMPRDYAKDGWLGGWRLKWIKEWLVKHKGFQAPNVTHLDW